MNFPKVTNFNLKKKLGQSICYTSYEAIDRTKDEPCVLKILDKYIVPIADIDEVIAISNYTSIPRSQGWLKGISNIRGNLVTLLDLHNIIFDTPSTADSQSKRALLVKQDSNYYGLVIDSIIGMKSYQSDKASDQVPDGFDPNYIGHISAFYQSGEEWFAALSIHNLLQDERFKQLSKIS